ncbi:MAG: hypothetical protein SGPRY_012706, partial [Prymnesium sp.]
MARQGVVTSALHAGTTYVCEIVYAANLVVVAYPPAREGVLLLGAVDDEGLELSRQQLEQAGRESGLPVVSLIASGRGGGAVGGRGDGREEGNGGREEEGGGGRKAGGGEKREEGSDGLRALRELFEQARS